MKRLCLTMTCIILTIVLVGGTTAHAFSTGQGVTGRNSEDLSQVSTFAGNGDFAQADGEALSASFRTPYSIVSLPDGSVLVSDSRNQLIRSIQKGEVGTYAGFTLERDEVGIPQGGWSDGTKESAVFSNPSGMTVDEDGNVYLSDAENNLIRKISTDGNVTTIAGNGLIGNKDGVGGDARFYYPQDVAISKDGTLYVADTLNHLIRKISAKGKVTTLNSPSTRTVEVVSGSVEFAGDYLDGNLKDAKFNEPSGLAIDSAGNLYVSDTGNQVIRYIDFSTNTVTTVAGNVNHSSSISQSNDMYVTGGYSDGSALEASFNFPKGLVVTEENGVAIADSLNHTIRYLLDGYVTTLAGDPSGNHGNLDGTNGFNQLHNPTDVAIMQDGSILIADSYNNRIRQITGDTLPSNLPYDDHSSIVGDSKTRAKSGIDETVKIIDVAPYIKGTKAYLPLGVLKFGFDVQWNQKNQIFIISKIFKNLLVLLQIGPKPIDTPREAQVEEVNGIVYIRKAGGAKTLRAYKGFILNNGDHIKTEANSSLVFNISDTGDQITAGENIQMYLSDLRNKSNNKITKFYVWSGSIWIKASSLENSDDKFEIETAIAFMGIRGTNLLVGVDPATGVSRFFIASGQGRVSSMNNQNQNSVVLLPSQQINITDTPYDNLDFNKNIVNLDDLVSNTSNAILEAIIRGKAAIDKENEQYISKLRESNQSDIGNLKDIDRIYQNLDNLVGNIINSAIIQNKLDAEGIKALIDNINQQLNRKLELNNIKPLEFSPEEKAKQEQMKLLEEERKKKLEAQKLGQDALKRQNEELLNKLNEQLEKQKEEKKRAEEAAKKKASEEYAKKLANEAAKQAFEAKKKALEEEKARQDAAASNMVKPPDNNSDRPRNDVKPREEEVAPVLTVESIIASDASTLTVKFAGMESVVITLPAPLYHEQSEVTFIYKGRAYTAILETPWIDIAVVDALIAAAIDSEITALPAVNEMTLDHEEDVAAVRERYNKLTDAQRSLVTKFSTLEAAKTKIAELKEALANDLLVVSVKDFTTIQVEYGASQPNLPGVATIVLSDASEVDVPVHWSGEIDVTVTGTQIIIGWLDLSTLEHVAPTELTVTIQVIVGEEVAPTN